ncbi:MAG TPA: M28 family peptidase [Gemmatimonadaceae bacterium]
MKVFARLTRCVLAASLIHLPMLALRAQSAALPLKHAPQPTTAPITTADLMTRLYIFADDSMMGREVGTPYHLKATSYIEREVRKLGLVPAGDSGTYFQNLPVYSHPLSPSSSIASGDKKFLPGSDFVPRDNSVFGGKVRSIDGTQVIFGGTLAPQSDSSAIVSREAAAGKFVVIAVPNGPNGKPMVAGYRQPLTGYYLGAAAVAVVAFDGFTPDERQALLEPTQTMAGEASNDLMLPAFLYITPAMAQAMLGAPIASLAKGATGTTLHGAITYDSTLAPGRNVVAILPGSDPKLKNEYVAIGAHNDHIGFDHAPVDHDSLRAYNTVVRPGGADDPDRPATAEEMTRVRQILDSLRKIHPPRLDSINNGADDDGTGTVATLEIAEAMAKGTKKPKRSILFVWHAGEEKGLWGSEYFTDHPTVPRDSIVAQLNMDMIGRGGPQDVKGGGPGYLQLIGSRRLSTELGDIVEAVGKAEPTPFHFDYSYDANGHPQQYYCRSDHYEYARYGIPITFFSTGGHRDYHQVTDEPQYIDYAQVARVANLVYDVALRVADLDHRVVVDKPKPDPHGQCKQ